MKQPIKPTKKYIAISFVLILLGMSLWALFDTIKADNPKRLYNNRYFKQIPMNEIGTTGLYKRNNAYKFDTLQTQAHFIYPVANNLVKEDNIIFNLYWNIKSLRLNKIHTSAICLLGKKV